MIEALHLSKRYGERLAVDDLSFEVLPGRVTGFLGPNGAGKSTTMRMIVGLDAPSGGSVTVCGQPYTQHGSPLSTVGALLDARAVHGGRSAYDHLLSLAHTHGLRRRRVQEVLELVGLAEVSRRPVRGFSLGMSQRLGIAVALLGDPEVLLFDEPVNGLDPEGIVWIRGLMRELAAQGRTVLVSSHLMSEMEHTADDLVVIGKGRLISSCTVDEFIERNCRTEVRVTTPEPARLVALLEEHGGTVRSEPDGSLVVGGLDAVRVGDLAFDGSVRIHQLVSVQASLEAAFMELTRSSVEYQASPSVGAPEAEVRS
ncbi:multidrug ABC transporter ATP-binding protein [Streptomyces malachitofuscus]|nr:multidrug ABC transporter ATP-binding protein [Streptomyces malachitofuscus]